ncbi:MAG: DUF421 domain-containing protein [Clostridia bacterium]|nr:DUF421 domain-containing protein [Clostridia bacterium]
MLSVFIKTIIIYVILTFMMKIMGKRRIGELEADELVSTLLISEIGAMPISDSSIPIVNAIIPIVFICALEVALSVIKNKSRMAKKILEGEPSYIIYKGRIIPEALTKNRVSINEVLAEMRSQGYGSITEIDYGILEANGKLSLIEKEAGKELGHPLIIDGAVNEAELMATGRDERWLDRFMAARGLSVGDILLLSVTDGGDFELVMKEGK